MQWPSAVLEAATKIGIVVCGRLCFGPGENVSGPCPPGAPPTTAEDRVPSGNAKSSVAKSRISHKTANYSGLQKITFQEANWMYVNSYVHPMHPRVDLHLGLIKFSEDPNCSGALQATSEREADTVTSYISENQYKLLFFF